MNATIILLSFLCMMSTFNTSLLLQLKQTAAVVIAVAVDKMTTKELAEAHAHHGILWSFQERDGEWYFLREGKKCKLFAYKAKGEQSTP